MCAFTSAQILVAGRIRIIAAWRRRIVRCSRGRAHRCANRSACNRGPCYGASTIPRAMIDRSMPVSAAVIAVPATMPDRAAVTADMGETAATWSTKREGVNEKRCRSARIVQAAFEHHNVEGERISLELRSLERDHGVVDIRAVAAKN